MRSPTPQTDAGSAFRPRLHAFAVFTAACTLLLIVAGALVTSNDAGLSVPDWPLSYGKIMPEMVGGVFYEHGHRMIASFVGLLMIALAVWVWKVEPRGWVRVLALAGLVAVIAQGVLGGLTVLFLLPTPVSVSHACLAQLFFCITVTLALATSRFWWNRYENGRSWVEDRRSPPLRLLSLAVSATVFLQLLFGAAFRHKGLGIAPHLVGAALVAVFVFWIVVRLAGAHSDRVIMHWGLALNGMVLLQLVLGSATYWIRHLTQDAIQPMPLMVALTVAHVALGALIFAAAVTLTVQVFAATSAESVELERRGAAAAV